MIGLYKNFKIAAHTINHIIELIFFSFGNIITINPINAIHSKIILNTIALKCSSITSNILLFDNVK